MRKEEKPADGRYEPEFESPPGYQYIMLHALQPFSNSL